MLKYSELCHSHNKTKQINTFFNFKLIIQTYSYCMELFSRRRYYTTIALHLSTKS